MEGLQEPLFFGGVGAGNSDEGLRRLGALLGLEVEFGVAGDVKAAGIGNKGEKAPFLLFVLDEEEVKAGKVYEGVRALSPDDVAEAIYWTATLPAHVNINILELMPVQQSFAGTTISRSKP